MFETPKSPYLVPFDGDFKLSEASSLVEVVPGDKSYKKRLAKLVDDSLRAALPRGFAPADAKRWAKVSNDYRYSFEDDRLIRKPPSERTPVVDR